MDKKAGAKIGIFGDTGMVGAEIDKLLSAHGGVEVVYRRNSRREEGSLADCALVFLATRDEESMRYARAAADADVKVVDMSGAFRIGLPEFEKWYGIKHGAPDLLQKAVYGMPALYADEIRGAGIVANPGCYPTAVILTLKPLRGLLRGEAIVFATSGNSGARREVEIDSNEISYSYGKLHKHVPEMNKYSGFDIDFNPIVIRSVYRGINACIRAELSDELSQADPTRAANAMESTIGAAYTEDDLVEIVRDTADHQFGTKDVNETNKLLIKVRVDGKYAYLNSLLDNLYKGAAGTAVENMNLMLGFPRLQGIAVTKMG